MSLYADSQKLSAVPNHEVEEIARDFILSFVTSKSGKSTAKIADEHLMSEDMVKRILQKWIKEHRKHAFESFLCAEIDNEREFYWFWKHCEDKVGKKLSWYNVWTYFYKSINLSTYSSDDIYKYFFHLYGMETTKYCILGGTLNQNGTVFNPVFIKDISIIQSTSYFEYKDDNIKEVSVKLPVSKQYGTTASLYHIIKLITNYNCDAYILAHNEPDPNSISFGPAAIKRTENTLEQMGVTMIDNIRIYKQDEKFYIDSSRLKKHNHGVSSYVKDIKELEILGVFETDKELDVDTKEADALKGYYNDTFLRHYSNNNDDF
ncbi:MAG: hypothetical protein J6S85_20015 [Methanobrevibacter sp.]|nr:hypothetical protein [Methanobrevibacter sp.]